MQTPHNIEDEERLLHRQSRVERIKEYVQANVERDLSSGSVAEKLGLNKTTLRRVFKKEQGESYHYYVERIRIERAAQLLTEGQWVKEAMTATGYKNRGTFNNAFKKRFKCPPGFFKK